jgi:lipopolysaccharide/colanic/teichoic acid biosynthesis glycosyltransferase
MLFNLLRGDLKLVGVRPLSRHYFSLYPEEFRKKRIKFKPGLIPPFYADLPSSLDEIIASEARYLDACEKSPFKTDFIYFWKSFRNILFCKARSK